MNKASPLIWLAIVLVLLVPSTVGRFLLDIAGGLILLSLLIPILIAGIGWIGLKLLQSRFKKCEKCGTTFINESSNCPICGSSILNINTKENTNQPASSVTIDIQPNEPN